MRLYLISQDSNDDYDTYDAAVVAAPDEDTARNMNPHNGKPMTKEDWNAPYTDWCRSPHDVKVELLGNYTKDDGIPCVILASFNAG